MIFAETSFVILLRKPEFRRKPRKKKAEKCNLAAKKKNRVYATDDDDDDDDNNNDGMVTQAAFASRLSGGARGLKTQGFHLLAVVPQVGVQN